MRKTPSLSLSAALLAAMSAVAATTGATSFQPASADPPATAPAPARDPALADVVLGMPDAPVQIVEYASTTCPACQHFHSKVLPMLKARYVFSGLASFIVRHHPTPPAPLSRAGAMLARCAGVDRYYSVLDDLFDNQAEILEAARLGAAQRALAEVAARHGFTPDQTARCIDDPRISDFLDRQSAEAGDIDRTPVVLVNGRPVPATYEAIVHAVEGELVLWRAAGLDASAPPDEAPDGSPPVAAQGEAPALTPGATPAPLD